MNDREGWDVIGDIHGHADALQRLLENLGYVKTGGAYRHPLRAVVFAGDFIDRGPDQRGVLQVARSMFDAGSARAVMGNHEFNALGWATPDGKGGHLRSHAPKNYHQHKAFLEQFVEGSEDYTEAVAWFRTLPLWLDLGGLRVIHACWHEASRAALTDVLDNRDRLTEDGLHLVNKRGHPAYIAAEVLLKGPEIQLPDGWSFHDKDGHLRSKARLRWWDPKATTYSTAVLGLDGGETLLPDDPLPPTFAYTGQTPVFFGHYWMLGEPHLLHPRVTCLDFSVAKTGYLAAYRWSGEKLLKARNLAWVPA